jgi:protein O-mannosyl-transferase
MRPDKDKIIDARKRREGWRVCWLALALAFGALACYGPVRGFDFVSYDDPVYVYHNPMVQRGLTGPGFVWAFKDLEGGNWNPLVWLSHMADCQLYGLKPGGHHVTNLALHVLNVWLLFMVLRSLTGAMWRSAFVAALFAWHPMHVESVAWVSERKDVLSTAFWLGAMWSYAAYARGAGARRPLCYGVTLLLFALGLMCKSMLVTLPVVFLLLDYWPLRRPEPVGKLVTEKLPFLALSASAGVLAIWAQKSAGAMPAVPAFLRLENAIVSCATYLERLFWPVDLGCFYPFPDTISVWRTAASVLVLGAVTWGVIRGTKARRYLGTGWFWYLGTLVPVIGVVQVGSQAMADRYTYVPYIGLAVMVSWGLADLAQAWPRGRPVLIGGAIVALVCCLAVTASQVKYWKDNRSLYEHTLSVTTGNYLIDENLGIEMGIEGKLDDAARLLQESVRLKPYWAPSYRDLARVFALQHRLDDALACDKAALRVAPADPDNVNNLAWIYATCPRADLRNGAEAVKLATRACEATQRKNIAILDTLAAAFAEVGRFDAAIETVGEMRAVAEANFDTNMARLAQQRLELYQAQKPLRDEE